VEITPVNELVAPKPTPTPAEYHKMMGVYFTERRDRVTRCGHKFDLRYEPRTQCPDCWGAFLYLSGETTALAEEIYQKEGRGMLIKLKGNRFVKWFERFRVEIKKKLNEENDRKESRQMEDNRGGREIPQQAV